MNWYTRTKIANELKRTSKKTLERLGVPFKEEIVGWKEYKGKYSPIKRLIVRDEDIEPYREWQEKTKEKRERSSKRQKEKKKEEREKAAKEIGCLMDSQCLEWYLSGKIDMQEAKRIANITERRHDSTEYEYLLDLGWSKEDAREYIRNNP
tara:strand:- start:33 stop:485 length:453 start_codon:yes stop_codon:yes gene_type:complete